MSLLRSEYEQRLGSDVTPRVRALLVAGAGFGMGFLGAFQTLTSLSEPARRAELLAAVFVVNYLAFSIPAVAAGVAVPSFGLPAVAQTYGSVVVVLALVLIAAESVTGRRRG